MILLIIGLLTTSSSIDMSAVRSSYHEIDSKQALTSFIDDVAQLNCKTCPAYLASAVMMRANYEFLPTKKWRYFTMGRDQLEDHIKQHPNDIEALYLRVLIQSNAPSFLGYNKNLVTDSQYIKTHIRQSTLPEVFQNKILTYVDKIDNDDL